MRETKRTLFGNSDTVCFHGAKRSETKGETALTIEEFCRERKVSKATVYRRLRETKIDLTSLRNEDGELTAEAVQMIAALTDRVQRYVKRDTGKNSDNPNTAQTTPETGIDAGAETAGTHTDTVAQAQAGRAVGGDPIVLAAQVAALRAELADTRSKLDAANAKIIELLEQAAAKAEEHAKAMQTMAERSQEVQAITAHAGRGLIEKIKAVFGRS